MVGIYAIAVKIDSFLLNGMLGVRFDVESLQELSKEHTYLIISNHKSGADILVFQSVLIDRTPVIKFIVKREVLFIPLIGLICWAYEYPRVYRSTLKSGFGKNRLNKDQRMLEKN